VNGNPLKSSDNSSPGIIKATLETNLGPQLYGAIPDEKGSLRLMRYDSAGLHWASTELLSGLDPSDPPAPPKLMGRPALAWVPPDRGNRIYPRPGRLYIVFTPASKKAGPGRVRMMISHVLVNSAGERHFRLGLKAYYQNSSYRAYGFDLYHEPGKDTNLRAAVARGGNAHRGQVWFRPLSDGIADYNYPDFDDWETMRVGLCAGVVNPGDLVDDPIRCPSS
jgi:hypothetical protein